MIRDDELDRASPESTRPGSIITTKSGLVGTVFFVCREAPGDGREPFVRIQSNAKNGRIHDVPASKIKRVDAPALPKWRDVFSEALGTMTIEPVPTVVQQVG